MTVPQPHGSTRTFVGDTGAQLCFDDVGHGVPIVALHGAYSTRHEIRSVLEPIVSATGTHRLLCPDLPGMGDSPPHDSIRTSHELVDLLEEFVHAELADAAFLLVGHSFGGHLARGLAARRDTNVAGLALICPFMPKSTKVESHHVISAGGDPADWLDAHLVDEFTGYFVVQTPATAGRFLDAVVPSLGRFDADSVASVMSHPSLDPDPDTVPVDAPTLVISGRHDSFVGYRDQMNLLGVYPRATFLAVADAGHAVALEHPELVGDLVTSWVQRCSRTTP